MLADTTWADFAVGLVPTIAALGAVLVSYLNRRLLKTPSGTSIGKQVESAHMTAISNNHRLVAMTKNLEVPVPPETEQHEAKIVDPMNGPSE